MTVTVLTVMSAPNDAVVITPWAKWVPWPVIVTLTFDCPCCALAGDSDVIVAGPGVTVKVVVTTSAPVVTLTVRPPVNAVGMMVMLAVADVGL